MGFHLNASTWSLSDRDPAGRAFFFIFAVLLDCLFSLLRVLQITMPDMRPLHCMKQWGSLFVQVSKTDPSPKREMPTMILFSVLFALRVRHYQDTLVFYISSTLCNVFVTRQFSVRQLKTWAQDTLFIDGLILSLRHYLFLYITSVSLSTCCFSALLYL